MTAAWKATVRARLTELGQSESWLARQIGERRNQRIKPDSVNKMLKQHRASIFVDDVCEILGISGPMVEPPDERTARIIELAMRAPDAIRDAVLVLLEGPQKK